MPAPTRTADSGVVVALQAVRMLASTPVLVLETLMLGVRRRCPCTATDALEGVTTQQLARLVTCTAALRLLRTTAGLVAMATDVVDTA